MFLFARLGEVFHAVRYDEYARGVGRPVARAPSTAEKFYVFAGEPGCHDAVTVAVPRLIVGCPFRGGEAGVFRGDRAGVLIAALFEVPLVRPPS